MNRRSFLIRSGLMLLTAGGGTMLFRSLNELKTVGRQGLTQGVEGLDADHAAILYFASLAPSGHNAQPWTVKILTENHWILGTAESRWLTVIDRGNREMLISLGAFLENLILAAQQYGYAVKSQLVPENSKSQAVIDITFYKGTIPYTTDCSHIEMRRTLRNNMLPTLLSPEDIDLLVGEQKETWFYFSQKSMEGQYLAAMTVEANKTQTYKEAAQIELAKWIRWPNRDVMKFRNGLTAETMEIEGVSRWYVKNFYTDKSVLGHDFRQATIEKIKEQTAAGSGWLLITSATSRQGLINVGRKLERIWLTLREHKIAIHPMNQLIEEETFKQVAAEKLGMKHELQLLLRVGYTAAYPMPVSPRMARETILL
ncbi:Acg family FMN-binding oxidoreductase [Propionispira raffinosivorans]|uniref:Acg family FMN-binding oxidoreductase n=1 Tax=Propionispira raffinosivorans TaxID=86959 RepID=UPI00037DCFAD|nr:hypothetical protein [Propionispira raffinosivorans]